MICWESQLETYSRPEILCKKLEFSKLKTKNFRVNPKIKLDHCSSSLNQSLGLKVKKKMKLIRIWHNCQCLRNHSHPFKTLCETISFVSNHTCVHENSFKAKVMCLNVLLPSAKFNHFKGAQFQTTQSNKHLPVHTSHWSLERLTCYYTSSYFATHLFRCYDTISPFILYSLTFFSTPALFTITVSTLFFCHLTLKLLQTKVMHQINKRLQHSFLFHSSRESEWKVLSRQCDKGDEERISENEIEKRMEKLFIVSCI